MSRSGRFGLILLGISLALVPAARAQTLYSINLPQGGDCYRIGSWNTATSTCTVTTTFNLHGDVVHIVGATVVLPSNLTLGVIENSGTLRVSSTVSFMSDVENRGRIEVETSGVVWIDGTVTNTAAGVIDVKGWLSPISGGAVNNAGFVHVRATGGISHQPGLVLTNDGIVLNEGGLGVSELRNRGRFFNHGRVFADVQAYSIGYFANAGEVWGTFANPGTLLNLCSAKLESVSGWTPLVGIVLDFEPEDLSWCSVPGVGLYDVVRGDLLDLIASGGNYASSTEGCVVNDSPTTVAQSIDPAPGEGFWFLVRPNGGSYDSHFPSQAASRDPEIADSGSDCL